MYLAKRICALMPPHLHFVEPYAGGLAVLLAKRFEGVSEVVNDVDSDLTNFWNVLKRPADFYAFQRVIEATPFGEHEWEDAGEDLKREGLNPVERAVAFFVRCRMSLAGRMDSFTGVTRTRTRRGMNNEVSAWLSCVEGLPTVHERLKRVLVLNRHALDVIAGQDGEGTLFYVDAPYVKDTRTAPDVYAHEMTDQQHEDLIGLLLKCKGKVMVSMYHHPIYDALHQQHGWRLVEFDISNHASGSKSKRRMTECLWLSWPEGR